MFPAVRGLRLLVGRGDPYGVLCYCVGNRGAASGSRHPPLVTGRPYGTGACEEGLQAHSVCRESCNSDSSPEPAAA
jgi:hypothetical protein